MRRIQIGSNLPSVACVLRCQPGDQPLFGCNYFDVNHWTQSLLTPPGNGAYSSSSGRTGMVIVMTSGHVLIVGDAVRDGASALQSLGLREVE